MKRRVFLKRYVGKFLLSLLLVGVITYTLFHVFGSTSGSLLTTPARLRTDWRLLSGEAYLFREERVLYVPRKGVVQTLAESGSKIAKNETLAEVWYGYGEDEIAAVQLRLDRLNRLIAVMEASVLPPDATLAEAEGYRAAAAETYLEIRRAIVSGAWRELGELEDRLLILLNRYETLIGRGESPTEALEGLREERTNLLRGSSTTVRNTASSGYFYDRTHVDGLESFFTPQALEDMSVQSFEELIARAPADGEGMAVGKMAYGYTWYLALVLSGEEAALLEEGVYYEGTLPDNDGRVLRLRCEQVRLSEDGRALAVFSSDEVQSDLEYLRSQRLEITVGHTTGYYVPESALYRVDGLDGVYVLEESIVRFRRVEILYRGDGYCIVAEQGDRGSEYLALNDLIVTSGGELYDGRVYE